ncbi:MAG: hypothetical protein GY861_05480 [bacterium]|nr:hypothetical protein [bacterium]
MAYTKAEITQLLVSIQQGDISIYRLPQDLYFELARDYELAMYRGYGKKLIDVGLFTPQYNDLVTLKRNAYKFAAAKTFQQVKHFAKISGKEDYLKQGRKDFNKFNKTWQTTERNLAQRTARATDKWREIQEVKDEFPLLKYQTANDERVRDDHAALDNIVKPVDDPFWNTFMPPNGYNCFDEETKIYTDDGWKYFKDLNGKERVMTLNPKTKEIEWDKPINYIKQKHNGDMIKVKSTVTDIMCTPDHNMLVQTSWDRHEKRDNLVFKQAQHIADSDLIYKSGEWSGVYVDSIKLGDYDIDTATYCEFMGWYLSEGSTTQRTENHYAIKISQSKKKYFEEVKKCVDKLPVSAYVSIGYIGFSDKSIGMELKKYGYSYQKYVPDSIKKLPIEYIDIFLDAYIKGDGNIRPPIRKQNGYFTKERRFIYTSSERMRDDLTELVIKSGKSCNVKIASRAGKETKFRNGTYKQNRDVYSINIMDTKKTSIHKRNMSRVHYEGYVYCVEVPKYNTILTQRNGCICWNGNCRCIVISVSDEPITKVPAKVIKQEKKDMPSVLRKNPGKDKFAMKSHSYYKVPNGMAELKKKNFDLPLPKDVL